jgi:hypothetical protein
MDITDRRARLRVSLAGLGLAGFLCSHGAATTQGATAERELGRVKIKPLRETSGIAVSRQNPDVVWLHNDGEASHLFAVSTTGRVAAQVRLPRGIEDLEDIAIAPAADEQHDELFLGDVGDNDGDRREVRVYCFAEPKLGAKSELIADEVRIYRFSYPDGPHDAEALLVDPRTRDLMIATKEEGRTRLYSAAAAELRDGAWVRLKLLCELKTDQVSGGDISRDGRSLILRSENRGWLWQRQPGESWETVIAGPPREVPVQGRRQGENGEAVAFAADGRAYLTVSEGKDERLYAFPLPGSFD